MGPARETAGLIHPGKVRLGAAAALAPDPSYATPGTLVAAAFPEAGGKPVGLLEVKTLMRHKRWLNNKDRELISILRTQGGLALGLALEREGRAG